MEVSKNDTLELIRKCMKEVKVRVDAFKNAKDFGKAAEYGAIEHNGAIEYMQVENLAEGDPKIALYYEKYERLERKLFNMENTQNIGTNTAAPAQSAPSTPKKSTVEKFVVLNLMSSILTNANEIATLLNNSHETVDNSAKDRVYLNAVITEIQKEFAIVNALEDHDEQLDLYFTKYTDISNKVSAIKNAYKTQREAKATTSSTAFEASRNAPKYKKEDVVALIADCKMNLAGLNDEGLIALEDMPAWEKLMDEISADYYNICKLDPRDKKAIETYYKKYVLVKKDIDRLVEDLTNSKDSKAKASSDIILKKDIIEKLEKSTKEIDEILKNKKLKRKIYNALAGIADAMEDLIEEVDKLDELKNQKELKEANKKADELISDYKSYGIESKRRVKAKIKDKDQSKKTRESREGLKSHLGTLLASFGGGMALTALVIFLILNLKGCESDKLLNNDSNKEPDDTRPGYEQTTPGTSIENVNIENYEELLNYAMTIQEKVNPSSPLSIEDIMYAIRLANFDGLSDKAVFRERDEVCASTYNMGAIARYAGINSILVKDPSSDIYIPDDKMLDITMCATDLNITRDDFEAAKTDKGYDVYTVCQICLDNMYGDDQDRAFYFCRIFNDITARLHQDFSIIPDCPISTRYVLAGMYTGNADKILELTAGQVLGPIYGSGYRIDGTYGNMCVEELEAFMRINRGAGEAVGNENNMLYTIIIDENITNHFDLASGSR